MQVGQVSAKADTQRAALQRRNLFHRLSTRKNAEDRFAPPIAVERANAAQAAHNLPILPLSLRATLRTATYRRNVCLILCAASSARILPETRRKTRRFTVRGGYP